MDLPAEYLQKQLIKDEKVDLEYDIVLETDSNVKVEIEDVHSPQLDWCVGNEIFFKSFEDPCEPKSEIVVYEELTEYGLQKCNICRKLFQDLYSLLCHKLIHLELRLKPLNLINHCKHCLKYYEDKLNLQYHIEWECCVDKNANNKEIKNPECKKVDTIRQCQICLKVFSYKIWYDHMKRVHSQECYQCEICNREFKAKRYLKRHMMSVHEGKQRSVKNIEANTKSEYFNCDQCPAVFSHPTPLHLHIKNCHCERVRCDKCSSLIKKSYLANHIRRVHYDDGKEHKCECGKKFRSPRYLKIHIKNSHSKSVSGYKSKRQMNQLVAPTSQGSPTQRKGAMTEPRLNKELKLDF